MGGSQSVYCTNGFDCKPQEINGTNYLLCKQENQETTESSPFVLGMILGLGFPALLALYCLSVNYKNWKKRERIILPK